MTRKFESVPGRCVVPSYETCPTPSSARADRDQYIRNPVSLERNEKLEV